MDRTGNTHGIMLSIRPPVKAIIRNFIIKRKVILPDFISVISKGIDSLIS